MKSGLHAIVNTFTSLDKVKYRSRLRSTKIPPPHSIHRPVSQSYYLPSPSPCCLLDVRDLQKPLTRKDPVAYT